MAFLYGTIRLPGHQFLHDRLIPALGRHDKRSCENSQTRAKKHRSTFREVGFKKPFFSVNNCSSSEKHARVYARRTCYALNLSANAIAGNGCDTNQLNGNRIECSTFPRLLKKTKLEDDLHSFPCFTFVHLKRKKESK